MMMETELLEKQYRQLDGACDAIAAKIDFLAKGSLSAYETLTLVAAAERLDDLMHEVYKRCKSL